MISDSKNSKDPQISKVEDDDKIDFIAIAKTIWCGRKTLLLSILVGSILGVLVYLFTPNEYIATTLMVPQTNGKNQSGLSSLASLAGLDLGTAENAELSPVIYPKIINSIPFKLELMKTSVNFSKFNKPVTIYDYYTTLQKPTILDIIKRYTLGLPRIILGSFKESTEISTSNKEYVNHPIFLTNKQYAVKKTLDECISLEVESKEGYLRLVVRMPEPLAAAQIAQKAQELLQRDITKFKVEKSQANLDFILERYYVAKAEAESYQVNIAVNTDRYKSLTSNVPQVSNTRIQTKYNIANSVYQDLAKQLEQAKIQVKRDTPVFTIIEPVSVPLEKSKPNGVKTIFLWIFISGIFGVCLIFGVKYFVLVKEKWSI